MTQHRLIPAKTRGISAWSSAWLALVLLLVPQEGRTASNDSAREDLLALLRERNIFDPNRRAAVRGEERREVNAPAPVHSFRLMGALIHGDKAFGFFDGSNSDYRRVVTTGDIIAGFRVAEIDTSAVKLERDGEELELEVGHGMSRLGEGEWAPTAADQITDFQEDPRPGGLEPERSVAPSPGGTQEDDNDVLRRMRERRRQEESR